jgi:hypothetical protein
MRGSKVKRNEMNIGIDTRIKEARKIYGYEGNF